MGAAAFLALSAAGIGAVCAAPAPLLWRVTGCTPGPSYLFGILHSADPRVTALAPPVRRAIDDSRRLVMEVLPTPATLAVLGAAGFDAAGPGLPARLGPALFAATARRIEPYGVPKDLLRRMRPWAVVATLSLPPPRAGLYQEFVVYLYARARGKPAAALLDPEAQVARFERLPGARQVALVRAVVDRHGAAVRALAEQRRAYLDGDLAALARLRRDYPTFRHHPAAAAAFRALLRRTARREVPRLLAQLRAGSRFAAITAINLPGPDGVLAGLRAGGCTLRRTGVPDAYAGSASTASKRQATVAPARNATTRASPNG